MGKGCVNEGCAISVGDVPQGPRQDLVVLGTVVGVLTAEEQLVVLCTNNDY